MSASRTPSIRVLWTTTIGLKLLMGISGLLLVGFVLGHMAGNLQVFMGREVYNHYAHTLQSLGEFLWIARFILLALLIVHVWAAVQLTKRNREARPSRYSVDKKLATTSFGLTMALSGLVILAYVGYHLAHFTVKVVHTEYIPAATPEGPDVYGFFVQSFQNPAITITYVIANLALAAHLSHATTSMFRTLGLSSGSYRTTWDKVGPAIGIIVAVGNLSMPLACLAGILTV